MSNEQNFESLIQQVCDVETEDFFEIAKISGLDPLTDFAGADLHQVNLSGKLLQGANFRKTNLSSSDLSNANLRSADLSYADLSGANLVNADLSEANLSHASVENAVFSNNRGIYERLKLNLEARGAIFENIPIQEDINIKAYKSLKEDKDWFNSYRGKFVIFVDGEWDGNAYEDEQDIYKLQKEKYPESPLYYKKVDEDLVIDQPIPGYDVEFYA